MAEVESKVENVSDIKPSKVKQINEEKASQLKKTNKNSDTKENDKFPVDVYVRMRPLVGDEIKENHEMINYTIKFNKKTKTSIAFKDNNENKDTNNETNNSAPKMPKRRDNKNGKKYKGFTKILIPKDNNNDTYNACIEPILVKFYNGLPICAFAYGHTGSGKSHTIFGYGDEHPGLCRLFAKEICNKISELNDGTVIEIRLLELYQGKIRDLLTKDKVECHLREDDRGNVHIRAPTVKYKNGKVVTPPIPGVHVTTIEELEQAIKDGIDSRNVGKSTLHDKSSRSHAFLEFELVTDELVKARNEVPNEEANLGYLKRQYDLVAKKVRKGNKEAAKAKVTASKAKIKELKKTIKSITNNPDKPYIGGTFVFVDLAGNEFGSDSKNKFHNSINNDDNKDEMTAEQKKQLKAQIEQERQERNEINSSLLALKEVIRALNGKRKHIPYRNHKLTMYLRQYLKGDGSKGIMISNIGPSNIHLKKTLNTMRYSESIANAAK